MLTRRGFTLVELLVALVLFGVVSTAIYRVLVNNQRIYQAQTQRIDLQQNIRAAVSILPAELRELDAADGDLIAMSPTAITVRAPRQLGIICGAPVIGPLVGNVAPVTMLIRTPLYGSRNLNPATDQLLVYYEGNQGATNDDGWLIGSITQDLAAGNCADGFNSPAWQYVASLRFGVNQVAITGNIPNGAPVRGFEPVTYSVYQAADGRWYLGYQAGGGTTQPLIGPVRDANGVLFEYFTSTGAATTVPVQVAQIRITLWGQTAQLVHKAGARDYVTDSIVTTVALRNNRRPNWVTIAPGS
ncbi:MAG: prepilin-type N-terminal cleavage/methylation domain-containing protein [Gemmatimonadales bacterium]